MHNGIGEGFAEGKVQVGTFFFGDADIFTDTLNGAACARNFAAGERHAQIKTHPIGLSRRLHVPFGDVPFLYHKNCPSFPCLTPTSV